MISPFSNSSIFELRKLDLDTNKLNSSSNILCLASNNNVVAVAIAPCSIMRFSLLGKSTNTEEIEVSNKPEDVIDKLFLDYTGNHLIITLKNGDNYYLHNRSNKVKKLSRLSGSIECIAFDRFNATESNTKSFLIGTSNGLIYEMSLDSSGKEKSLTVLKQFEDSNPITSIYFEYVHDTNAGGSSIFSSTSSSQVSDRSSLVSSTAGVESNSKIFIMFVSTLPSKLWYVFGGPSFQNCFNDLSISSLDLPGELKRSELRVYSKKMSGKLQNFALMTGAGVYYGSLLGISTGSDNIVEAHLLPYPSLEYGEPLYLSVSDFHFLVLYANSLQIFSSLSGEIVQQESIPHTKTIGLVRDAIKNTTLLYTDNSIYQVNTTEEDRNIWLTFLNKAIQTGDDTNFELALEHARNNENKSFIMKKRANYYLFKNEFQKAALYYSKSNSKFEEVVLKLLSPIHDYNLTESISTSTSSIQSTPSVSLSLPPSLPLTLTDSNELNALKIYLLEVLAELPNSSKSQRCVISTWISEIYLHQITISGHTGQISRNKTLTIEFQKFLENNHASLDLNTIINLILNRNNRELLLFFSRLKSNYYRIINILITEKRYSEALDVIQTADMRSISSFLYKITPLTVEFEPFKTFKVLLEKESLTFSLLLPTILCYCRLYDKELLKIKKQNILALAENKEEAEYTISPNLAIDFMEHLFTRSFHSNNVSSYDIEPILVHTLVWLLCKYDDTEDRLSSLLSDLYDFYDIEKLNQSLVLDFDYILRQCRQYQKRRCEVYSLLLLKDMTQAVTNALNIDVEFAKTIASKCKDNELKKKLWLLIAQNVILNINNMKQAVELIHDSSKILTIEDLLPILPDFTEIDIIRTEICMSLKGTAKGINNIRDEINDLAESVESTVKELDTMRHKGYSTISNYQQCDLCCTILMGSQFYLYPCSHGFHSNCLLSHTKKCLNSNDLQVIETLETSLKQLQVLKESNNTDNKIKVRYEAIQEEIDSYIAADCPLCGYVMINAVEKPFDSNTEEAKKWEL